LLDFSLFIRAEHPLASISISSSGPAEMRLDTGGRGQRIESLLLEERGAPGI
jgi:hypothetical protein